VVVLAVAIAVDHARRDRLSPTVAPDWDELEDWLPRRF
jgi:hypothetical protein